MDIRKSHGPSHGSACTCFALRLAPHGPHVPVLVSSCLELIHPSVRNRRVELATNRNPRRTCPRANGPWAWTHEGREAAYDLPIGLCPIRVSFLERWRGWAIQISAPPTAWPHPHVTPSRNPRRHHLKFRATRHRGPSPSALPAEERRLPAQPPANQRGPARAEHACPQVEALQAGRLVECLYEGGLVEDGSFRFAEGFTATWAWPSITLPPSTRPRDEGLITTWVSNPTQESVSESMPWGHDTRNAPRASVDVARPQGQAITNTPGTRT